MSKEKKVLRKTAMDMLIDFLNMRIAWREQSNCEGDEASILELEEVMYKAKELRDSELTNMEDAYKAGVWHEGNYIDSDFTDWLWKEFEQEEWWKNDSDKKSDDTVRQAD
jgi:hypothetical protein